MFGAGVDEMGMISMPNRLSRPVNTELSPGDVDIIGVILTDGGIAFLLSSDVLLLLPASVDVVDAPPNVIFALVPTVPCVINNGSSLLFFDFFRDKPSLS